jgi:hypothetical protein
VGFRLMPMAEGSKDLPGHRHHRRGDAGVLGDISRADFEAIGGYDGA